MSRGVLPSLQPSALGPRPSPEKKSVPSRPLSIGPIVAACGLSLPPAGCYGFNPAYDGPGAQASDDSQTGGATGGSATGGATGSGSTSQAGSASGNGGTSAVARRQGRLRSPGYEPHERARSCGQRLSAWAPHEARRILQRGVLARRKRSGSGRNFRVDGRHALGLRSLGPQRAQRYLGRRGLRGDVQHPRWME